MSNEVEVSSTIPVTNLSDVPTSVISSSPQVKGLMKELASWTNNARNASNRSNMFNRASYTPPDNPYDEMRAAKIALEYDEIVAGVAEITESYAFQGIKWESENLDDADVFNQLSAQLDLDDVMRKMLREEFVYSQVVVATRWDWREFTVRGRSAVPMKKVIDQFGNEQWVEERDPKTNQRKRGPKRKKTYRVWAPVEMRILDASKIVPVGVGPLGGDRLAWMATKDEMAYFNSVASGEVVDLGVQRFYSGVYTPDRGERQALSQLGVDPSRLLLLNPEYVFRHTATMPDYQRFPEMRLKSCFSLLDMKRQLINADRAALVGAANYILLVRKGSKEDPATPEEVAHLRDNYNFIAKVPVIISDHRLEIEIIAPKTDLTLQSEKYDVIDKRILGRLLGSLDLNDSSRNDQTVAHTVAKLMENRRHMLRRTLEREIGRKVFNHPNNAGVFEEEPNLVFTPRNIALSFNQAEVQALLALRTQREVSRETVLEYFGLDEGNEAQRMELEEMYYDQIFKTQIPFSSPNMTPSQSGPTGGRPNGGGESPKNATKVENKTSTGNTSTKGK